MAQDQEPQYQGWFRDQKPPILRKGSRDPEPLVPEKAQGQGTINFRTAQGLGTTGPRKANFFSIFTD